MKEFSNTDDFLTVTAVAKRLGVPSRRIRAMCAENHIGTKVNSRLIILSKVDAMVIRDCIIRRGVIRGRSKIALTHFRRIAAARAIENLREENDN